MGSTSRLGSVAGPAAFDGTRVIVVSALLVGAVLGFGGNFVGPRGLQSVLWGVSALGLIVGCVLLAVEHAVVGNRAAAAGFAVLALGESRVLNPTTAPGGEASFAAGVLLYAAGLLLVSVSGWAPRWVRIVGAVAALPFAVHALLHFGGGSVDSTGPLAATGYTLFTVTVVGWALVVARSGDSVRPGRRPPTASAAG
jgi:hypothetical protein